MKAHIYRNEGFNRIQSVLHELETKSTLSHSGLMIDERSPSAKVGDDNPNNKEGSKTDEDEDDDNAGDKTSDKVDTRDDVDAGRQLTWMTTATRSRRCPPTTG